MRVGHGWDRHRLEAGRPLVLGGLAVESDRGAVGHSDADVLLHALTDALLGAAGAGDIGDLFPDDDPAWRGAESRVFLARAVELADEAGLGVVNADLTLLLEAPKLGGMKSEIRSNVARLLRVSTERVGLKAKSGEGIGPVGRGEAVEAHAVVLLAERTL